MNDTYHATKPRPMHRDYTATVPVYRYVLTKCGHTVYSQTPIPLNGYAWCRKCKRTWRNTWTTAREIRPRAETTAALLAQNEALEPAKRKRPRVLSERDLMDRMDKGILMNRAADMLLGRTYWTIEECDMLALTMVWEPEHRHPAYKRPAGGKRNGRVTRGLVEEVMADLRILPSEHHEAASDEWNEPTDDDLKAIEKEQADEGTLI